MIGQTDLVSFCSTQAPSCKRCGSSNIKKNGRYRRVSKQTHIYHCKRCGCRFVLATSDLERMRHNSSIVSFAVDLYTNTGIALRTLVRKLKEYFGIAVSHVTVRRWCKKASNSIYIPRVSDLKTRFWCVDETKIRINGRHVMLWVVIDPENKVVLAWHVSKGWSMHDAVHLLKTAFEQTGNRPWQIITDHLPLYVRAIQLVFRNSKTKHIEVEHIQDTLQRNNYIERLFREVKRRTKWFSAFRAYSSVSDFMNVFFYCYNHNKWHRTIKRTPLEYRTVREALIRASLM